jgi:fibronectin type 3 domain-containing protein
MAEIAGYRIYFGDSQGSYMHQFEINNAYDSDVSSAELQLSSGVYYAVVTTVDTDGRESAFSQEVTLRL